MAVAKLERLMNLVAELRRAERPLTARQLRERVPGYGEVDGDSFKRAFERDKAELRDTGVPLVIEKVTVDGEVVDGYRIDRDEYLLPDPGLDADEHAALILAGNAVRLQGHSATGGLQKLGGAGSGSASIPDNMAILPSAPHLSTLFQACTEDRRVRFVHRDKARTLDPVRLHHERRWYLQAYDLDAEAVRLYRLDRIEGDGELGDAGSADTAVHASDHPIELASWALGDGPVTPVRLRAAPGVAGVASRAVGAEGTTWHEDGSATLAMSVRNSAALRDFVLSFGGDVVIESPDAWHEDLVAHLRSIADAGGTD